MSLHRSTEPSRPAAASFTSLSLRAKRVPRGASARALRRGEHAQPDRACRGLGLGMRGRCARERARARTAMRRSNTKRALWKVERAIIAEGAVTPAAVAVATLQGPHALPPQTLGTSAIRRPTRARFRPAGSTDQRPRRARRRCSRAARSPPMRCRARSPTRSSPACRCRRACTATCTADSRTRCSARRASSRSARPRRSR